MKKKPVNYPFMPLLKHKGRYKYGDQPMRDVYRQITDIVPKDWIEKRVREAARVVETLADAYGNPVYGWSGGKDSQALQVVLDRTDVNSGVMCHAGEGLEFAPFMKWVLRNIPDGVLRAEVDWLNEDFVRMNPEYLWCRNNAKLELKFQDWHHRNPTKRYYDDMKAGIIFFGRRMQDKNPNANPHKPTKAGRRTSNPIHDWCHEEVMAAVVYYGKSLAPAYDYRYGWHDGPSCWNRRTVDSDEDGWSTTFDIDPGVVLRMAETFEGAKRELVRRGF